MMELAFTYPNPCRWEHQRALGFTEICKVNGGFFNPGSGHDHALLHFKSTSEARSFFAESDMDYIGHFKSRKEAVAAAQKRNAEL